MGPLYLDMSVQVTLGDIPSFCITWLSVISRLAGVHSTPQSKSLIKMFKSTNPKTDPRRTPLMTSLWLDVEPVTTTLWIWPSNLFFILCPLNSRPFKSLSLQFRDKHITQCITLMMWILLHQKKYSLCLFFKEGKSYM